MTRRLFTEKESAVLRVKYASKCQLRGGRYAIKQRKAVNDSCRTKGCFSSVNYTHVYMTASKNYILKGDRTALW